ncbi:MAG: magnesium chelatase domain-containing protein, partial [Candidatus Halalkalibacterium sp. M3_1C_030]
MLSRVYCASTIGVDAKLIEVETSLSGGLPRFYLVGLPDRAVSEARDRVEAAVKNTGASFPFGKVTVNLAPADLPKEGSAFDLPIAVAILEASGQLRSNKFEDTLILGELALDGKLRPVKGILPMVVEARDR